MAALSCLQAPFRSARSTRAAREPSPTLSPWPRVSAGRPRAGLATADDGR